MPKTIRLQNMKRGDTIIEVMIAITIFCMVAVLSVTMMNLGTNNAQSALELAIARNEINAQAEALRFIHSAYISEGTLPEEPEEIVSNSNNPNAWYESLVNNRYQQYRELWKTIVDNAITPEQAQNSKVLNLADFLNSSTEDINYKNYGCDRVYEEGPNGSTWLSRNNAFILNTRNLNKLEYGSTTGQLVGTDVSYSYIKATNNNSGLDSGVFQPAPLNARILYREAPEDGTDLNDSVSEDSSTMIAERHTYDYIYRAEGIWVIAVKEKNLGEGATEDKESRYYDFYIESCWYGPNTTSPTTIDTVIRLYNPENVK